MVSRRHRREPRRLLRPWQAAWCLVLAGCESDGGDGMGSPAAVPHGAVLMAFVRSEAEPTDPFEGTSTLSITMEYGPCLRTFYREHPRLAQSQPEGHDVFEAALDDGETPLCDTPRPFPRGHCRVHDIVQTLDERPRLTVTFEQVEKLEFVGVPLGPIPSPEAAQCPGGRYDTTMLLRTAADVVPLDAAGEPPWFVESFAPDMPVVGANGAVVVHARRIDRD